MSRWNEATDAQLREAWAKFRGGMTRIAKFLSSPGDVVTRGMVDGRSRVLRLPGYPTGGARIASADVQARGVTVYENRRTEPGDTPLKPGGYNRKLGYTVEKGRWKGMAIYALSLEERATCPRTCKHWATCYGNNMSFATRHTHGEELDNAIMAQLPKLLRKHPQGIVVRLHTLGDFFSMGYVMFWIEMLSRHPGLNVFGYTAWQPDTPIGGMIASLREDHWDRFSIRTSGAAEGPRTSVNGTEGIHCPVERHLSRDCGTCALCWAVPTKPIIFEAH